MAAELSAEALIPEVKWQRTSDLIVAQSANAIVLEKLEQLTAKVVSYLALFYPFSFCCNDSSTNWAASSKIPQTESISMRKVMQDRENINRLGLYSLWK